MIQLPDTQGCDSGFDFLEVFIVELDFLKDGEKKAIRLFETRLRHIFSKRLIVLKIYGSIVREERWEESDLDILVLVRDLSWEEKRRVWNKATNVNIECDTMISPLVLKPEEFQELRDRERRIALDIDREGISL